ncbi:MAG: hypothetical protein ACREQA_19650 [Candidatus Binatia bacterium]
MRDKIFKPIRAWLAQSDRLWGSPGHPPSFEAVTPAARKLAAIATNGVIKSRDGYVELEDSGATQEGISLSLIGVEKLMRDFVVRSEGQGKYEVLVDGHRISNIVTKIDMTLSAKDFPVVQISLLAPTVETVLNEKPIYKLNPDMIRVLESLGWTPPENGENQ